jgi:site-specific DNA-methyltransferase (adenine-specific)
MSQQVIEGDNLATLKTYPDNYFDAVVTDPPYGLSFMGKKWDYDVPRVELWAEVFRVLKPGGHLLAFAGTRTQHRMAVNIEDAGFEIRDLIAWVYGSGFPKSLDISKAIDKAEGVEREILGNKIRLGDKKFYPTNSKKENRANFAISSVGGDFTQRGRTTAPATDAAKEWEGWGTALKPALEPITVARKPIEQTVAANVLKYGTGGLNIDGARVGTEKVAKFISAPNEAKGQGLFKGTILNTIKVCEIGEIEGRWPANLIHDGSEDVLNLFPNENEESAARFFYCPKASKSERDNGLKGFNDVQKWKNGGGGTGIKDRENITARNFHPTVKPVDLMRYLVKLVTPKGGTVLDPFNGSGTTGVACKLEGFNYVGLEFDPEYCKISRARIQNYQWNPAPEPEPTAPNQLNLFE